MGKQWKRTSFDHHRSNTNERKGNRVPSKNDLKSEKKMVKVPKYTEIIKLIYPTDPSFHGFPWKKNRSICHALALSFSYSWERLAIKRPRHLWSAWCCCYCELSIIGLEKRDMLQSKVTFPNLPPAQGCASPSSSRVRVSLKKTGVASD